MPFSFLNLDAETRSLMGEEIETDISSDALYISNRLSEIGKLKYPELLKQAVRRGTEVSLAQELRLPGIMGSTEQKRSPKGGVTTAAIPVTAPETLAEGEFNRFYIRAICRRAIGDGTGSVTIYRAKAVTNARSASEAKIGQKADAKQVLNDLRSNIGVDTALGLPSGPNSGLSVKLGS